MRQVIVPVFIALLFFALPTYSDENEAVSKSQIAATTWLILTDSGKYPESWEEAAASIKLAITKPDWERALKSYRSPLGTLKSRKLKSATFTRTLSGAPDGEYVVIQYDTQFENKASAIETVTPMHEKDGSWRVSGYYIK